MDNKSLNNSGKGDAKEHGTSVTGSGDALDRRMGDGEDASTLTTRQGHPVHNNQNIRTVGTRGPATLENYQFIEKITHFDRERIPERVVHARGAGAHGYFEAYGKVGEEPISKYTRAKLFQEAGKKTLCLSVFLRSFMGDIPRRRFAIREASPSNFIRRMGTGISSATI